MILLLNFAFISALVTPYNEDIKPTGGEISYQDYYKKHYNIEIEDLQQPLLIHRCTLVKCSHRRNQK